MGGGSSSQQKTNQINRDVVEKTKQQQQNKANSKDKKVNTQKLSMPQNKNIMKNGPETQKDKENKNNDQTALSNPLSKSYQNITSQILSIGMTKQNIQINQSIELQLKRTLNKSNPRGQTKIYVSILRISPNSEFPHFQNLEQTQSNYQSLWAWNFDEKQKYWNFFLKEPQSTGVRFLINQQFNFIQGDHYEWILLNQMVSTIQKVIDKKKYFQQITDLSFQDENIDNPTGSFQQLQNNHKKLYNAFNQEYVERFAHFPQLKNQKPKNKQKSFQDNYTHLIIKKFDSKTQQWLMTVETLQNPDQFSCCMLWRTDLKDKSKLISELVDEQKEKLQLKKQIYIHKMGSFKQ